MARQKSQQTLFTFNVDMLGNFTKQVRIKAATYETALERAQKKVPQGINFYLDENN